VGQGSSFPPDLPPTPLPFSPQLGAQRVSSSHAPLPASWMPSPPHADDALRTPVTTRTGTAPVCSPPGESYAVPKLSPSPVAPPAHGVQILNGANE